MIRRSTILVADDDPDILKLIEHSFGKESQNKFKIIPVLDGEKALDMIKSKKPDLVILDVNMPGANGLEVCRSLRAGSQTRDIPIIFLSGRVEEMDRILGLEFGADDYVTKPFNAKELFLRIQNVLKRVYGHSDKSENLTQGILSVDFARHEVKVKGQSVQLTLTEFKLLACLLENTGQVKTRDYLLEEIWDNGDGVFSRTIDTHIQRLRTKLSEAGRYIETVRGVGYRFQT